MKQENFLFVDIVSAIFLLLLMVGNLLGLLYITEGNFAVSLLVSLFIIVCYYFIIQMLKRSKEKMANKSYIIPESLFFLVFIIFGAASLFFMSHFINIETNAKDKIIEDAVAKIDDVKQLPLKYDNLSKQEILNFEGDLTNKLQTYKSTRGKELKEVLEAEPYLIDEVVLQAPQFIDVRSVTDSRLNPLKLKVQGNINKLEKDIDPQAEEYLNIFQNWDRLKIITSYDDLNKFIDTSYSMANEKVLELPLKATAFEYVEGNTNLPLSNPIALNKIYPPDYVIPLIVVVLLHLFILIPFFTHKVRKYNTPPNGEGPIEGGHII